MICLQNLPIIIINNSYFFQSSQLLALGILFDWVNSAYSNVLQKKPKSTNLSHPVCLIVLIIKLYFHLNLIWSRLDLLIEFLIVCFCFSPLIIIWLLFSLVFYVGKGNLFNIFFSTATCYCYFVLHSVVHAIHHLAKSVLSTRQLWRNRYQ